MKIDLMKYSKKLIYEQTSNLKEFVFQEYRNQADDF